MPMSNPDRRCTMSLRVLLNLSASAENSLSSFGAAHQPAVILSRKDAVPR